MITLKDSDIDCPTKTLIEGDHVTIVFEYEDNVFAIEYDNHDFAINGIKPPANLKVTKQNDNWYDKFLRKYDPELVERIMNGDVETI